MLKTRLPAGKTLPLVVGIEGAARDAGPRPDTHTRRWLERRDELREKLLAHGALLLRGGRALEPPELAHFVREFSGRELLDYAGGVSPRVALGGRVYTSTEYPEHYTLSLHNEMSYTYRWPALLFFHCAVAPAGGGETPVADSRRLLGAIGAEVVGRFKRGGGVMYERNLTGDAASGYSWQAAFETEDGRVVEDYCRRGGVSFTWKGDGGLRLSEVRPATAAHPQTGEEVWFNQADGFHPSGMDDETYRALVATLGEDNLRLNARFGDGSPIDAALLERVRAAFRAEMALVPWRAGDTLILDNMLAAHGRMPFTGPRKILLAMT
ncbi:MAG TPA: TauD/TfdA family dioxygenase [Pyrinomonadaceae bacterium]|nr:TauD/TfdA family dioxygenase [Pyrinomonadaceae bacterium]